MAVRIRLARVGATKRPSYRVVAIDRRRARDGRALEILGFYDPLSDPATVQLDEERIREWMRNGATPSDMVVRLMRQAGFAGIPPAPRTERAETGTLKQSRKRKAAAAAAADGAAPTTSADPATPAQAADPPAPAEATEAAAPTDTTPAEEPTVPEAATTGSAVESPLDEATGEVDAADATTAEATGDVGVADAAAEAPDVGDATESTVVEEQASR